MARLAFDPVPNLDATWYVTDTYAGDAHLGLVALTEDGWVPRDDRGRHTPAATRQEAGQILAERADAHFGVALRMY